MKANNDTAMTYEQFSQKVIKHLGRYNRWEKGTWRGVEYDHIVEIPGKSKLDTIREIMRNDGLTEQELDLFTKPHRDAHHLNSSQVLCYEFFRPMMTVGNPGVKCGQANKRLVDFVKEALGVIITENAVCQFEYEDKTTQKNFKQFVQGKGNGEKSSFDFHIQDGNMEIYFEIKFTEPSFGGWTKNKKTSDKAIENHCAYIQEGYKPMLEKSLYFKKECKNDIEAIKKAEFSDPHQLFNKHYQLFRNALKADANTYTVFIYPNANPGPQHEFEDFKKSYLVDGQNHIIALRWEDLKPYIELEKFKEKYIQVLE